MPDSNLRSIHIISHSHVFITPNGSMHAARVLSS